MPIYALLRAQPPLSECWLSPAKVRLAAAATTISASERRRQLKRNAAARRLIRISMKSDQAGGFNGKRYGALGIGRIKPFAAIQISKSGTVGG